MVTSPTGAVIRDILHRLADRFPRHVLIWPVAVQGEKAAGEVAAAIAGFNRLPGQGPVPRPDILIVARGGGSLEDLWAFNEEIVVRAAAASTIPLISGGGPRDRHHPDRFRLRPPRADADRGGRDGGAGARRPDGPDARFRQAHHGLHEPRAARGEPRRAGLARGLGDPRRLIEERQQRLDVSGERLALATRQLVERRGHALAAARLASPVAVINAKQQLLVGEARALKSAMERFKGDTLQKIGRTSDRLEQYGERLRRCGAELLEHGRRQVDQLGKLLESYSFHSVLNRGFALVRDQDGASGAGGGGNARRRHDQHRIRRRPHRRQGDRRADCAATGRAAPARAGSGNQGSLRRAALEEELSSRARQRNQGPAFGSG